jgi:hypothetical protein
VNRRAAAKRKSGWPELIIGVALVAFIAHLTGGKFPLSAGTTGGIPAAVAPAQVTDTSLVPVTALGPAACGCHVTTMPQAANEQLADRMAAGWPWRYPPASVTCLNLLWSYESAYTWSPTVQNPTSPAYGIPQSDPGGQMASAGADWATNPVTQIRWGLDYLGSRYGGPCGGWDHELASNWY